MMVLDQAGLLVLKPGEDGRYRLSPVVPDSDRHCVHEQSDHRVGARQLRRSARHRGAEHHVVPPGQCAEHDRPGALQHGVEGQAVRAGEVGHRAGRGLVQDRLDLPLGPVPAGPRTVGLPCDRSGSARLPTDGAEPGRLLHTRQRAGPGRDRAGTVPRTQPGDVVPHLRRRWERATARVVVQRHQLAQHDRQRPSIHDKVVDGQHQARTPLVQPKQRHPQQRGYGKVEGPGPVVVRDPGGVLGRSTAEVDLAPRHLDVAGRPDGLHGSAVVGVVEGRPQARMPTQQRVRRVAQTLGVHASRNLCEVHDELDDVRVVGATRARVVEESFCQRTHRKHLTASRLPARRRLAARHRLADHRRHVRYVRQHSGQPRRRGMGEDIVRRTGESHRPQPRHQEHRQDAVAAECEEAVVYADARNAQRLCEQPAHQLLPWRTRLRVAGQRGEVRRRQSGTVQLAVDRERHGGQPDEDRRDHVRRQDRTKSTPKLVRIRAWLGGTGVVADQPLVVHQDRRVHDTRAPGQRRLDLTELDPKAAQLHLVVDPAEVVQGTVRTPAGQVAGAVHARSRRSGRIGHEPFGRQPGPGEIAAGELDPRQVELPALADCHRSKCVVEHPQAGVPDRAPDRHRTPVRRRARPRGDVDRRLGRPVQIVQGGARGGADRRVEARRQLGRQRLAAAEHPAQ